MRYEVRTYGTARPYVYDTETRVNVMSYDTDEEAHAMARTLNSFVRPAGFGSGRVDNFLRHESAYEAAGMAWWNRLTTQERALALAEVPTIAQAWELHKARRESA